MLCPIALHHQKKYYLCMPLFVCLFVCYLLHRYVAYYSNLTKALHSHTEIFIHTVHTYTHTYSAYIQYIHTLTCIHTYYACILYIHIKYACIHTYIHTQYLYTYIHTYIQLAQGENTRAAVAAPPTTSSPATADLSQQAVGTKIS